jgi:hypothetical protein
MVYDVDGIKQRNPIADVVAAGVEGDQSAGP